MRIYYLSASEIPSKSANSVHVMKMCNAFCAQGHDIRLWARKGSTDTQTPFTIYGVKKKFPIHFFSWSKFRVAGPLIYIWHVFLNLLRSPRPDLFYSRYAYLLYPVSFLGIPCIYEAHVLPPNSVQRLVEGLLMKRKTFRRLVVISDALKRDYLSAYPSLDEGTIITAHDGADIPEENREKTTGKPPENKRKTLQIGYVGHLYPGKGMEMIAALAPRFPQLTFHVVGGRDSDLAFWKAHEKFPNLLFHGYVNHGELGNYYNQFDIFLIPFQTRVRLENGTGNTARWMSPLKLFEYMAYGKAIIASDLPVLREVLENNRTALMVPPEDITAWAEALNTLAGDSLLRFRLGRAARKLLEREYTWDRRVLRVLP